METAKVEGILGGDTSLGRCKRLDALDGLRGIAALVVVVFHFLSAFAAKIVPDQSDTVPFWVDTPVGILFNGPFAVSVFFVLSGFVLSHSLMPQRSGRWLISAVVFRYFRLAVPITASTVLAWFLLKLDGTAARELVALVPSRWLQWTYQDPIPTFKYALLDGLIDVFWRGSSQFNNVLWTIRAEFIGSLGIYFFFFFVGRFRLWAGWGVTLAIIVLKVPVAYACFAFGAMLSLYWSRHVKANNWFAWFALVAGVVLGSQARGFADRHGFEGWTDPLWMPGNTEGILYPVGAALLLFAVLSLRGLNNLLSGTAFVRLGAVSFPLYLVHVPLIYTLVARVFVNCGGLTGSGLLGLFAFYVAICFLFAKAMQLAFDEPLISMIRTAKAVSFKSQGI